MNLLQCNTMPSRCENQNKIFLGVFHYSEMYVYVDVV